MVLAWIDRRCAGDWKKWEPKMVGRWDFSGKLVQTFVSRYKSAGNEWNELFSCHQVFLMAFLSDGARERAG
jgi:hypothetical protein